ncbi:MAG: hypothetical protein K0S71_2894 [Clostridia bacterium]|jgi:hypothetical protein|nr:hypothetical protein [Clostridia bacterium]
MIKLMRMIILGMCLIILTSNTVLASSGEQQMKLYSTALTSEAEEFMAVENKQVPKANSSFRTYVVCIVMVLTISVITKSRTKISEIKRE